MKALNDAAGAFHARPEPAELVARARALLPILRERSAANEANRMVDARTIDAFRDAQFFEILKPAAWGGFEYEPQVAYEVMIELAKGCTASAWVGGLLMIHNWEIGLMNAKLAREIWGENPDTLISSSYAPFGKAEEVDGGFLVSGRWPWSSGCDHAQWVVVGALSPVLDSEGKLQGMRQRAFFIPQPDYTIDQSSWHMAGMQGTGSKDIIVERVFVPNHRQHDLSTSLLDKSLGAGSFTAPTYKYPFATVFSHTLATVITGSAMAALELTLGSIRGKRTHAGAEAARSPLLQLRIGEAWAAVNAARAISQKDFAEAKGFIDQGLSIPIENRMLYKWNAAHCARLAVDAVAKLVKISGGGTFALSNPLQRILRDTECASNHVFVSYENGASNAGWALLSGEISDLLV